MYVAGTDQKVAYNYDFRTLKYNSSGILQWSRRYNGPVSDNDYANSMQVDNAGNVYVTGQSIGNSFTWDITTVKYNSSGVQQWIKRYNGSANNFDGANALAIDLSGNVYVAGTSRGANSDLDFITIKYSSQGLRTGDIDEGISESTILSVNVFPNPFRDQTMIEFNSTIASTVSISIFDINGKRVTDEIIKQISEGINQQVINLEGIEPGYYFCRINCDGKSETKQLILSE